MILTTSQEIALRFCVKVLALAYEAEGLPLDACPVTRLFNTVATVCDGEGLPGDAIADNARVNGLSSFEELEGVALILLEEEAGV